MTNVLTSIVIDVIDVIKGNPMQASSFNPVRLPPDDLYIISSNSLTQPPKKEGCPYNYKAEKYKPTSNFSSDIMHEPLTTDSNKKLLKSYKSLRERIIIGLDHMFDGTEKTFKRKLSIKAGCETAAIFFTFFGSIAAIYSATTILCPVPPAFAGALVAVSGTGAVALSASVGYSLRTLGEEKYYLHEWTWFQYFVDEQHRKLFLKEVPEPEDIKALEDLVGTIKDKLAPDQFDETYKDMQKKIKDASSNWYKQRVLTDTPLVFDIYLELAKQRCAKHHSASITAGVKCENPDNLSNNIPVAKMFSRPQHQAV